MDHRRACDSRAIHEGGAQSASLSINYTKGCTERPTVDAFPGGGGLRGCSKRETAVKAHQGVAQSLRLSVDFMQKVQQV